jgi:hypothetical protein
VPEDMNAGLNPPPALEQDTIQKWPKLGVSGRSYLNDLLAEFAVLSASSARNQRAKELAERVQRRGANGHAGWDDVHGLEIAPIELWPIEQLQRRVWLQRASLREAIGEERYAEYLRSLPPNLETAESLLRADAHQTLIELYRFRALEWAASAVRSRALRSALFGFVVSAVSVFVVLWLINHFSSSGVPGFRFFSLLLILGSLGGLVSAMQRIRSGQISSLKSIETLPTWPTALGPVIGVFASLFFYAILRSGLLSGELFPTFSQDPTKVWELVAMDKGTEYFKLAIWSFVSGFSEKLLPDQLAWFAGRAAQSVSGEAETTTGTPESSKRNG